MDDNAFNTDPPGTADAKCPQVSMAGMAEEETMERTAELTSDSLGRMWTSEAEARWSDVAVVVVA